MQKKWLKIGIFACMLQVLWGNSGAVQSSEASAPKTVVARYVTRVNLVHQDLRWALAHLWVSLEEAQRIRDLMESKRQKSTEEMEYQQIRWTQQKSVLLQDAEKVQANAKRMRSLTPVPRILKRVDDKLVEASLELERGLEMLETWTRLPADEHQNSAAKQIRRAQTLLDTALKDIVRRTDSKITGKAYLD